MKNLINILLITVFLLASCAGKKTVVESQSINTKWKLTHIEGFENEFSSPKGAPIIIINMPDSTYSGHSGCNSYSGSVSISGNKIKFLPALATKMYCKDEGLEMAYFKMLNSVTDYQIEANKLKLLSQSKVVATFNQEDAE